MSLCQKRSKNNRAFSLVEIMVAAMVLGLGILPMLSLLTSSRRNVQYVGFHMMASQLATNKVDRILALDYETSRYEASVQQALGRQDALEEMQQILTDFPDNPEIQLMRDDLTRAFNNLEYSLDFLPGDKMFMLSVTVYFSTVAGKEQQICLEAIKFAEGGR